MRYLATHRALLPAYLRALAFPAPPDSSPDIYADPLAALSSAYPEILEFTTHAVGISSEFDAVRKEYPKWHNQAVFQGELAAWVERDFFPALLESRHDQFPPNLLFSLFTLLNSLFSRVITTRSAQLPLVYEALFEALKRNLHQPFGKQELHVFENCYDNIFRQFRCHSAPESSDSSQTEQIDMAVEHVPLSNSAAKSKDKEIAEREETMRFKRMEFRFCLAQSSHAKGDMERFLKEVGAMLNDVSNKIHMENYSNEAQWPAFIRLFIRNAHEWNLVEAVIALPLPPNDSQLRNIIYKLQVLMNDRVLELLVQYEKLYLLRHLLQPGSNRPYLSIQFLNSMIDQIIANSHKTKNTKEYL
jgi:hypothetical protein